MKIKDLNPDESLGGVRFRYPGDGKLYYWHSQWKKGILGKKKLADSQVYPLFCEDLSEVEEWEVIQPSVAS